MDITRTRHGLRLSQHGVVISELRTTPGPTHSVFDVVAAVVAGFAPRGRIGVLGFAGGGIMAPLAGLGVESIVCAVDLNRAGYVLFRRHCPGWIRHVNWQQADATDWLRQQRRGFGLLVDDLSVSHGGDVIKPAISWSPLPTLMHQRLRSDGLAVFNLLPLPGGRWNPQLARIAGEFETARIILLDDFENRILIAGRKLPPAREVGRRVREALRRIRSRQAGRIQVRAV